MRNKIFKLSVLAMAGLLISCQEKLDTVDTQAPSVAYVKDKLESVSFKKITDSGNTEVEIRLSTLAKKDVQLTISAEDFLAEFNKKNRTSYQALPSSAYQLYEVANPANSSANGTLHLTIKENSAVAKVGVRVSPLSYAEFPVKLRYAIPLRITAASTTILSDKDVVITFNRPFKTSVAEIKQGHNFQVLLDPEIPTATEFTIQGHFMFLNWNTITHPWNQSLINFNGSDKHENSYYTRVGKDLFQVKDLDLDGEATHVKHDVKLNHWFQLSFVYKNDILKVYVNGKLGRAFVRPQLGFIQGKGGHITMANAEAGDSRDYRIREVRVWNRALSEAEINDGLYMPASADAEGLLVYMPLDKETGFKDISKYNNKVICRKDVGGTVKVITADEMSAEAVWTDNVKFPADEFVIDNE